MTNCGNCCGKPNGQITGAVITSVTGNQVLGKISDFVVSTITCERNIKAFQALITISPFAFLSYISSESSKNSLPFKPFVISETKLDPKNFTAIVNAKTYEGTADNEIIYSSNSGSEIFAKGGMNFFVANQASDRFHFSACSAHIKDNVVQNVILNFDPINDKVIFRCTKTPLYHDNVTILHDKIDTTEVTYVHVRGIEANSSVALIGNYDIESKDIELNTPWVIL